VWRARTALSSPDHTLPDYALPDHTFPYTGTMAPRVTWFAGEARNSIVWAISSGFGQDAWSASGIYLRFAGVSMVEGAMALTRMPSFTTSWASATVSAATAAFVAV
jgi:hypothetical protein